ncbi:MAG TPA: hypothetical protein VGO45_14245 [Bacteroidia bacterium]|nr:hypothetical protein [Bacteroidia bacterium]
MKKMTLILASAFLFGGLSFAQNGSKPAPKKPESKKEAKKADKKTDAKAKKENVKPK